MKKIIITGTGMKTWKHMAILTENLDVSEMFLELGENLKNYESQNILLDLKNGKATLSTVSFHSILMVRK